MLQDNPDTNLFDRVTSKSVTYSCPNHYRSECIYCYEIILQCACHNTIAKNIERTAICGTCYKLLPKKSTDSSINI